MARQTQALDVRCLVAPALTAELAMVSLLEAVFDGVPTSSAVQHAFPISRGFSRFLIAVDLLGLGFLAELLRLAVFRHGGSDEQVGLAVKVLVCGGRDYADFETVHKHLSELPPDTVIVHGAASGADALAERAATELGFEVRRYPADWKRWGKSAGPIRNRQMLEAEFPNLVIAFPGGKGTRHMVNVARERKIPVMIIYKELYFRLEMNEAFRPIERP